MNNIFKILFTSLLFAVLAWVTSSCSSEDFPENENNKSVSEAYMKLQLNIPEYKIPEEIGTMAMNPKDECAVKPNLLNILVFHEDDTFYYKAPLVGNSLTVDATDPSKATATIKLVKSTNSEKFNLVVIANHDLSGISIQEGVTTKSELLKKLTYSVPSGGKWNAETDNSTPFPMWAELKNVIVNENMNPVALNLYRALARVDVGLAFKFSTDGSLKFTEEALGLDNFSIKEVNVYRTYDKGHVAPLRSDYTTTPSIPTEAGATAVRYSDDQPLAYQIDASVGANSYVREIYLPEADLPSSAANHNMHCVVVGGYYGGSTTVTYYRLDFAEDIDKDTRNYQPILRNHRYVFNILSVKGAGFETAEQALTSTPSGTLEYEMIKWDESIHEMHVHGKYYFGLNNQDILFAAKATSEEPENVFNIKYQTNYNLIPDDGITLEWDNVKNDPQAEPKYQATWEPATKSIKIVALTTNETNTLLPDVLFVKAGPFTIKVNVTQEFVNFKYTVDCASVVVRGTYRPGYNLNTTHFITLNITAEDKSINGTDYIIETEPINGIVFKARGTFNVSQGNLKVTGIKLMGEGKLETPDDQKTDPFTVKIVTNSSSGSYCEATITPVMPKLKVASIANGLSYGYDLGLTRGGVNKVVTSPNNFGPNDNSIVKIEGFQISRLGNNFSSLTNDSKKWLQTGMEVLDDDNVTRPYLADILYVGHDGLYDINDDGANTIMEYMRKGGVVVMFNEGIIGPQNILEKIFAGASVSYSGTTQGLFAFPGHENYRAAYPASATKPWDTYFAELQNDPILFGPFGDLRDKQWGEDSYRIVYVTIPNMETYQNLTVYTYATNNISNVTEKSKVCGFRYESDDINLVWFGDGGFMSSSSGSPGGDSSACPFYWNTSTFFPTPKPNYKSGVAYNSQALCNIMAWAVDRSAELFNRREAAMGR